MNRSDYSTTTDVRTVSTTSNTSNINTINTSKTAELQQLIVVSTLWVLSICLLTYMMLESSDIRIELLLVLALMIGVPIMFWTYITLSKWKGQ